MWTSEDEKSNQRCNRLFRKVNSVSSDLTMRCPSQDHVLNARGTILEDSENLKRKDLSGVGPFRESCPWPLPVPPPPSHFLSTVINFSVYFHGGLTPVNPKAKETSCPLNHLCCYSNGRSNQASAGFNVVLTGHPHNPGEQLKVILGVPYLCWLWGRDTVDLVS